ncbi:AMP-binding protein [Dactylosporangium roseum]|uniref:AMP-binding protein n=1 Tax=Dactylosporangium roseum TaxID=47989 RepID=A0ABY5YXC8_9ACTN|nr:AMP-binding protein [Dactylosporangium roseum]UWZ34403.1 AMP-binding protein [Dactylosporangium roseum]
MTDPLPREYTPRTVPALLRKRAADLGDRPAVSGRDGAGYRTLSYTELDTASSRLAGGLLAAGVAAPGAPVAWAIGNDHGIAGLVLYHAVLKAGAVNVPMSPRLSPVEVAGLLDHCGAETLVVAGDAAPVPGVRTVAVAELAEHAGPGPAHRADEIDLAAVLYTSGTTGLPKGVEHTHASSLAAGIAWADCFRLTGDDVLQSPFPVVSGAGLHFNAMSCLWAGGHVVVDEPVLPGCLERIEQFGATVYVAVPSIYQYWLAYDGLADHDLGSLRLLDYGGASMATSVIERLSERLPGVGFMQTYGFTEAGPGGTYLPAEYTRHRPGSIGARAAGRASRFRVVDDAGREVVAGVPGELQFRGPSVMRGYHRDPEATASVFVDGWIRSGDIVRFDDEGFLYFVDRRRELIVRGGYNIAPAEIEHALLRHPDVLEAAVFGVSHEALGEVPVAAVVLRPGAPATELSIVEYCRTVLADFKAPRVVRLVDELPKNAAGKTLKNVLRESLA